MFIVSIYNDNAIRLLSISVSHFNLGQHISKTGIRPADNVLFRLVRVYIFKVNSSIIVIPGEAMLRRESQSQPNT